MAQTSNDVPKGKYIPKPYNKDDAKQDMADYRKMRKMVSTQSNKTFAKKAAPKKVNKKVITTKQ